MPEAHAAHPSEQELSEFGLGKLPRADADAVAAHLETCRDCLDRLDRSEPDSFVGRLRAAAPRGDTVTPLEGGATPSPEARRLDAAADFPPELAALGKFEVLGKLGQGGMGAVWKARHLFLDRVVAIKVMRDAALGSEEARGRFLQEMRAGGRLSHPNVAQTIDAAGAGGVLFLVLEYVDGVSLDKLVARKGPLPARLACRCASQAAEGLAHAHALDMVHRDVKPHNLMLTRDGLVKVLDFGLARLPRGSGQSRRTRHETFLGTAEYVAPEQAKDARSADIRSDIYSLGCTLYFLLSGRPPFRGENAYEVAAMHLTESPAPLAGVPAGLWEVVARMMAKDREQRYQTPAEVIDALAPFARRDDAAPPPLPPPLPAPARRWPAPLTLAGAGAAAVLLLAGAWWLLKGNGGRVEPDEAAPAPAARAEVFRPLFNGKDLAGWEQSGGKTTRFTVADGVLTARNTGPANWIDDLYTAGPAHRDFRLRYRVKHDDDKGSRVTVRVDPSPVVFGGMRGYQVELVGAAGGGEPSARLLLSSRVRPGYELASARPAGLTRGAWHQVEVVAQDNRLRVVLDGKPVLDHTDEGRTFLEGAVALCVKDGSTVHYRDVEVADLASAPTPIGERQRWTYKDLTGNEFNERWGVFQHAGGQEWIESGTNHPRKFFRLRFTEATRTDEYVELDRVREDGKTLSVRLYRDRATVRRPDEDWQPLFDGAWVAPTK